MIKVCVAGGFDPIHIGHVRHIHAAKQLGDYLVVIVNTNHDMIMKKGYYFMTLDERMEIIKALRDVDMVVASIDTDGTVAETLIRIQPTIFAKGGDRLPDNMPQNEIDVCEEVHCKIVYGVGDKKVQSSSRLVSLARGIR